MKKAILFLFAAVLALGLNAQTTLSTTKDSASFGYGVLIGNSLKRQLPDGIDIDLVMKGMADVLKDAPLPFSQEMASDVFGRYSQEAQKKAGEAGKMEGEKFLAENKKREGVTTTSSGLQYEVMKRGEGKESPKATDKVRVHYHGTTIDGSVFDSSVERGETISFGLNQVISGWTEGVQLMRVGDKFKFFIPSELAYGERSPSPKIKPNSVLIFEVELFEINPKD
jgi:FKBP-type peptidyl-prolyl cis-trans isomerase FklB